jgi:META domain
VIGLLANLASCSSTPASGVSSASLAGKTFVSTSVTGHTLAAGSTVTLTFEGPILAASAGCNTMSAAYAADNSTLRWTGPPRSTLIGYARTRPVVGELSADGRSRVTHRTAAVADQQFDHHETRSKVVRAVAG